MKDNDKMKLITETGIARAALRRKCLEYRAKHRITQHQLAILCDLDRSCIVKIEGEKRVSQITEIKVLRIITDQII